MDSEKTIVVDGQEIKLEKKPGPFSSMFRKKTPKIQKQTPQTESGQTSQAHSGPANPNDMREPSAFRKKIENFGKKRKGLEAAMKEQQMKISMYDFVRNMLIAAVALGAITGAASLILFLRILPTETAALLLSAMVGLMVGLFTFQLFLGFPLRKGSRSSKNIERDILFAARDLIISLRSGMPLFNAITSVSTGYGDASTEFSKIVDKVQLGVPLEDAIDQTVAATKSPSFRRIMLQAAVSIRAGADVTSALQSIIDQLSQERVIELRRYGQKLNAIAMFYMLFGIIVPSMGIAVLTILTTFISIFTVNITILEFALVGIIFLQIVFLKMIGSSRPVFTM
jgi:pilus assembly protein TadC